LRKYAIIKPIYAIKIERTGTDTQKTKDVSKQIFVYRIRIFWAGRPICNCHLIVEVLANTFTVTVIVFNNRLACLNDHCIKMTSRGWWKGTVSKYTQKNAIPNYFQMQNTTTEAE